MGGDVDTGELRRRMDLDDLTPVSTDTLRTLLDAYDERRRLWEHITTGTFLPTTDGGRYILGADDMADLSQQQSHAREVESAARALLETADSVIAGESEDPFDDLYQSADALRSLLNTEGDDRG